MQATHPRVSRPQPSIIQTLVAAGLCLTTLAAAPQKGSTTKGTAPGQTGSSGQEKSVRPGINKKFLSDKLNVKKYTNTFETESREVFTHRHRIAKHVGIRPGMTVADIGAGTGLFLDLFCKGVADGGLLFAVDIAPRFIKHLHQRSALKNHTQVLPIQCSGTSTRLPTASVDIAFTCDTYHHFEYPKSTLASLHAAIKPGGQLIIVDFERIEGVSRKFIMGHVRCGKSRVIEEVTAAGFKMIEEIKVRGLKENYFLRFQRPKL